MAAKGIAIVHAQSIRSLAVADGAAIADVGAVVVIVVVSVGGSCRCG